MTSESVATQAADVPLGTEARIAVERHDNFEELRDIEAEWDALVEEAGGDIYATFSWCRIWWNYYGHDRRLMILLFRQNGSLVGIFPLFFETVRLFAIPIRLVRLVGCDYSVTTCSPVVEPGLEGPVVALVAEALAAERFRWEVVQIGPLPGYARRAKDLASAARDAFPDEQVKLEPAECHTVFDLPETYEEYLGTLSAKESSRIRQDERRLQKLGVSTRIRPGTSMLQPRVLNTFVRMHEHVWQEQGKLGHFQDWPHAREFHSSLVSDMASKGRASFWELVSEDEPIAVQYGFRIGEMVHWFLTARSLDPRWRRVSLGRAGLLALIRDSIDNDVRTVDGLGGYYEYKVRLGGRLSQKQTILVTKEDPGVRARWRLFRWVAWALNKVYFALWFARVGPKCGLLRGPLWRTWIRSQV